MSKVKKGNSNFAPMKTRMKFLALTLVVFLLPCVAMAGMGGGPLPPPPCGGPFPPCPVPLDGGTVFLALAGAAFGIKKIYKNIQTPD